MPIERRAKADRVAQYPRDPGDHPVSLHRVRSTTLCSGISEFRARGIFDRYAAELAPAAREIMLTAVPGVWLSLDIAMAHFAAVDALGLPTEEAFSIGAASGQRSHGSKLQTSMRLAAGALATPWTVFEMLEHIWGRSWDGGAFVATRMGPKDALLELSAMPPCQFAYFRNAFRGAMWRAVTFCAKTVYSSELPSHSNAAGVSIRFSWV